MILNFRKAGLGISAAAALFSAVAFVPGAEKVDLRIALQKGKSYESDSKMQMNTEVMGQAMLMQIGMASKMTVTDVKKDDQVVDFSYTRLKIQMPPMPGVENMNFDSENPDPKSSTAAQFKQIAASKVSLVLTPAGKVKDVKGLKEAAEKAAGDNPVMSELFNEASFSSQIEQGFNYLPEKPVGVGDSWTKDQPVQSQLPMKVLMTYKVKSITKDKVIVDVNGVVKSDPNAPASPGLEGLVISGTSAGTMELEKATGFVTSSQVNMNAVATKDGAEFMKMNITNNLTGKVK